MRLHLIADIPANGTGRGGAEAKSVSTQLTEVLDLLVVLLSKKTFLSACITLCNEDAIRDLEAVMEESLDQDESIAWPEDQGAPVVTAAHERFAPPAR
ncbi:MAG: hypothetical protein FD149_1892 [Rhodospirillaceae bacterium]|nr:MAG: hypothetical protein FD149_1892 [Rhodospirillaceae bacterium]